jgi:hypothetical protein
MRNPFALDIWPNHRSIARHKVCLKRGWSWPIWSWRNRTYEPVDPRPFEIRDFPHAQYFMLWWLVFLCHIWPLNLRTDQALSKTELIRCELYLPFILFECPSSPHGLNIGDISSGAMLSCHGRFRSCMRNLSYYSRGRGGARNSKPWKNTLTLQDKGIWISAGNEQRYFDHLSGA